MADSPPGEDTQTVLRTPEADDRLPTSADVRSKRHGVPWAGVAAAIMAVGTAVFFLSPYNHFYSVPRLASTVRHAAASAGIAIPAVLAPSASLARLTLPPATPPATPAPYATKPRGEEVAEILSLHPGATVLPVAVASIPAAPMIRPLTAGQPARARPAVSPGAVNPPATVVATADAVSSAVPSGHATGEPAPAAQPLHPRDNTPAILTATPASAAPVAKPIPATPSAMSATPASADPIAIAHNLRAAPMASPEQVQVLGVVTEMASIVKHLREQNAQLRADFGKSAADTARRLADYERRLALAEARSAVTAASDAADPPPALPATHPASSVARSASMPRATAALPTGTGSAVAKTYRVQAASPGLALLAEVDRGGGEGAQIQVIVGDTIPDLGRVKSIAQRGTAWIVTTEHGQIQ